MGQIRFDHAGNNPKDSLFVDGFKKTGLVFFVADEYPSSGDDRHTTVFISKDQARELRDFLNNHLEK